MSAILDQILRKVPFRDTGIRRLAWDFSPGEMRLVFFNGEWISVWTYKVSRHD